MIKIQIEKINQQLWPSNSAGVSPHLVDITSHNYLQHQHIVAKLSSLHYCKSQSYYHFNFTAYNRSTLHRLNATTSYTYHKLCFLLLTQHQPKTSTNQISLTLVKIAPRASSCVLSINILLIK
jgi:carbohydrate-binding DOMON domain-containing protein